MTRLDSEAAAAVWITVTGALYACMTYVVALNRLDNGLVAAVIGIAIVTVAGCMAQRTIETEYNLISSGKAIDALRTIIGADCDDYTVDDYCETAIDEVKLLRKHAAKAQP